MRMKAYRHNHNKEMNTPAVAQMAAIMLYNKRFFPYYISNILAGLDENGKGVLYSYDPVSKIVTYLLLEGRIPALSGRGILGPSLLAGDQLRRILTGWYLAAFHLLRF
jgi:Proteasome subunit